MKPNGLPERDTVTGHASGLAGAQVAVSDLSWRPYGRQQPVLSGLTFTARPGERILLTGPSGCGKSTLLRALAGVLASTEGGELTGTILVDGVSPDGAHAAVGLLLQDPADALVAATVGREVAFGPENAGLSRSTLWARVHESLDAVTFPYGVGRAVGALSGGEQQRLALAGVLALGPRLIVLDEPTGMLDRETASHVRHAIWQAVRASGATVIVVEHHIEPWLLDIDRVIVLDLNGQIAADGPPATTLVAEAATLEALGVWIPGHAAPVPLALERSLVQPARPTGAAGTQVVVGTPVVVVSGASVEHAVRRQIGANQPAATALDNVDATARAGEILVLVGHSGAGKSTLASLCAGLVAPTTGTVRLCDADGVELPHDLWLAGSRDLAAAVGWVPQQAELAVVARTVREDALSTSRVLGLPGAETRADALLTALGLAGSKNADPHELSGGESRRLALVGAIAHGPRLLVLDEPTVGQDRHTWAAVAGVIVAARDSGVAVVVATHDPLLIALADRVIRLEKGRVAGEAHPPVEPKPEPAGRRVRVPLAARAGPLSLLGASILLIIGALFISDFRVGAVAVALELLLAPLVCGWAVPVRRLLPAMLAVVSVTFSNWLLSTGHDLAGATTAGLRVAFFALPGVLLARFIDPIALGDHLAQRLHLPPRPVVAAAAALHRLDLMGEQWNQLAQTRRVRGLDAGHSPGARIRRLAALTFALLVQALRHSGRLAVAMEARGFSATRPAGVRRSWAEPALWRRSDSVLLTLAVVVAVVPIVLGLIMR